MKRDARMFDIIQILRDGKLHTAAELAARLGVSPRTVWRDMAVMAATGLPVTGGRGLGYMLRSPLMLPPMVLAQDEMEALATGLRHVEAHDPHLSRAAKTLLYKIATLLPQADLSGGTGSGEAQKAGEVPPRPRKE